MTSEEITNPPLFAQLQYSSVGGWAEYILILSRRYPKITDNEFATESETLVPTEENLTIVWVTEKAEKK